MNGQALYRRWRSQTFDEIIAQDHVTRTLQNALRDGRVAHAYLFCGPRGTGKTSTARILAKAVNCLAEPAERPCNRCARCEAINAGRDLDLIEIDAASNRGIDEIRDLRDKIAFAPNEGRFKVYVVDEVHMLTTEAFNALLKTLEEPPGHVIFVLATTEPQRIPPTILSRCQRFDFRRIPLADLKGKLERICAAEEIEAEPAALDAIARRASGSFRDAESLLDQLAAYGDTGITLERVRDLLGGVSTAAVGDLVQAWIDSDLSGGFKLINRLVDEGADARQLHLEVIEYLRSLLLVHAGGDQAPANVSAELASRMRQQVAGLSLARLVGALRLFGQRESLARGEVRPQLPLELAFAQAVLQGQGQAETAATQAHTAAQARPPTSQRKARPAGRVPPGEHGQARRRPRAARAAGPVEAKAQEGRREELHPPAAAAPEAGRDAAPGTGAAAVTTPAELAEQWPELLQRVRPASKMLEALLRSARPRALGEGRVLLEVDGEFHRSRLAEGANPRILEQALAEMLGSPCRVECVLAGKGRPEARVEDSLDNPVVRDDRVVRYAVQDLGAQVSAIRQVDEAHDEPGSPDEQGKQE